MDGAYSAHGWYEQCVQNTFDKPKNKSCMVELGIDGRIMVEWMFEVWNRLA